MDFVGDLAPSPIQCPASASNLMTKWLALDMLARDRMMDFQEAFRDLLKHNGPTDLKTGFQIEQ
jgi:hypothetical protein